MALGATAVPQHEEGGDREEHNPEAADEHGDPDVHAVRVGDAEEPDLGLDEEEIQEEQDEDAAEVIPQLKPETRPTVIVVATWSIVAL